MEHVLVVGAGFMGAGIAQVCAASGRRVSLTDVSAEALDRAGQAIASSLGKLAAKGKLSESSDDVAARVEMVQDLAPAATADWVVEAALEKEELKREIFAELDRLAPADTPLGSNTSSIPIGRLAEATARPERVLGLHFFGPVPLMGLVEVVKGPATSDEVFSRCLEFIASLGKTPVKVTRDLPGFVMNRVFAAAFSEATDLVATGVTTPQDVDAGMKLGYGWGAGPFEIADNAGLDTIMLVEAFMSSAGEGKLVARSNLVGRLVARGCLGRKVGQGFYTYGEDGKRRARPDKYWLSLAEGAQD